VAVKLAIPENSFSEHIVPGLDDELENKRLRELGIQLIRTTEDKCQKMLANRQVDAALLTPLSFGRLADTSSMRVIPNYCVAPEDFTGAATLYFKGGISGIESIGSPSPHSYLAVLSKILLSELYGIESNIEKSKSNKDDILHEHDIAILYFEDKPGIEALDLSEEWLQLYREPLPLFFWVCYADNQIPELRNAIDNTVPDSLPTYRDIVLEGEEMRKGRLHFVWHEKIEKAIDHTLEILYYHQYFKEIHSIKLFDPSEGKEP